MCIEIYLMTSLMKRHNVGLWLDSEFENGCSKRSDTYLNSTLASSEDFSVVVVELWGLAGIASS